jgi:mono/diheme cytochrome c family protein
MNGVGVKRQTALCRVFLCIALLVLTLGGAHLAVAAEPAFLLPENPLRGRGLLVKKGCLTCHQILGKGGTIAPDLGKVRFNMSLSQIAIVMWNHSPIMAEKMHELKLPWPTFSVEEMTDLIAFLYYMDYFLSYLEEPGDVQAGRQLFTDKGCKACHALEGEGGNIGPSLERVKGYTSPIFMAQALWNHGQAMATKMQQMGIAIPTFKGNEMADLIAYIRAATQGEAQERLYLPPGNPRQGERLFAAKGCTTCHALRGAGGGVGPDLAKEEFRQSLTRIAGIMWDHGPKMWQRMAEAGLQRPTFTVTEMADLIAYLYFLRYIDEPGNLPAGQRLFAANCAACHAINGEGGGMGPDLGKSEAPHTVIGISAAMWNHAPRMQQMMQEKGMSWPQFAAAEAIDLLAYLQSVQGNPVTGQRLFAANCAACHAINGEGGGVGPDLGESEATRTVMGISAAMWNHAPRMQQALREKGISWPKFTTAEMVDLLVYLQSVRGASPAAK